MVIIRTGIRLFCGLGEPLQILRDATLPSVCGAPPPSHRHQSLVADENEQTCTLLADSEPRVAGSFHVSVASIAATNDNGVLFIFGKWWHLNKDH